MLALFAFLGAFGPLLRVSWLLVGFLGRFFGGQERSGLDFEVFGTLPGKFLEPLTSIFPMFLAHVGLLFAQAQDMQKP